MGNYFVVREGRRVAELSEDAPAARARIDQALRDGGDYVRFQTTRGFLDVLVTRRTHAEVVEWRELDGDEQVTAAGASTLQSVAPTTEEFDEWGI